MLAFLEKMREQHKDDDEVLVAINEVENEINEKKYCLNPPTYFLEHIESPD